jgi:hypothetical protein
MKNHVISFLSAIVLVFILSACSQKKPSISEDLLAGDWYAIKGDVESYNFMKDDTSKTFTSYLHSSPFMYGTWKIKGQTLTITAEDGTTNEYGLTVRPDTLLFNDGEQIYTKTIPLEVMHPEIAIMNEISSELKIPLVSTPQSVDFSWQKPAIDSTMSDLEINLKGFETGLNCTNKSEDRIRVADYLQNNGFVLDTAYRAITEIAVIIGYWKDDQLVTLSDIYSDTEEGEIDPSVLWIRSLKIIEE